MGGGAVAIFRKKLLKKSSKLKIKVLMSLKTMVISIIKITHKVHQSEGLIFFSKLPDTFTF